MPDAIVTRFEVLKQYESAASRLLPFAVEASWITSRWDKLQGYLKLSAEKGTGEFNVGIGSALNALRENGTTAFVEIVNELRLSVAKSLTANSVASLQSCHDDMLRLHALADVEAIVHAGPDDSHPPKEFLLRTMNRRLDVLGGYLADKQYLLGLRRAAMELTYVYIDFVGFVIIDFFLGAVLATLTYRLLGSPVPISREKAISLAKHTTQCYMPHA